MLKKLHILLLTLLAAACLAAAVAAGAVVTMDIKTLTIPSKPKEIPVCLAFCKGPDGEIIEFFQEL